MARDQLGSSLDSLSETRTALVGLADRLAKVGDLIKETTAVDPMPTKFVGVVDNYRFTTGPKGEMPTHRFEVLCGNGLFLHVEARPEQFALMMQDMDMGDIKPSKVNNKLVMVERNKDSGTIPVKMFAADLLSAQDKWDNFLWSEAPVKIVPTGERGRIAKGANVLTNNKDITQPYVEVEIFDEDGRVDRQAPKYFKDLVLDL